MAWRSQSHLSVILIDVDYFKEYNDNYGHLEGDKCLQQVAQTLKNTLYRTTDFIARYGGDEFVVILSQTDKSGTMLVAENLMDTLHKENIVHNYSPISNKVTLTLGVTTLIPDESLELEDALNFADNALYVAKGRGRNQIEFL